MGKKAAMASFSEELLLGSDSFKSSRKVVYSLPQSKFFTSPESTDDIVFNGRDGFTIYQASHYFASSSK